MNRLVIVGGLGNKRVYLNVSRQEAVERYTKRFPFDEFGVGKVSEFEFENEFEAYDVWPIGGWAT